MRRIRTWFNSKPSFWVHLLAGLIGVLAYGFLLILELTSRSVALSGLYFQKWSSEDLMQTVSLMDLEREPLISLWNLHIQPPLFDIIRAIFAQLWPSPYLSELVMHVDILLYQLGMLLYALLGMLIFYWLVQFIRPIIAFGITLLFLLHPATLAFATLLDSTFLSTFLITLMFYSLWKIKNGFEQSTLLLSLVVIAAFLTRSVFQLPLILILLVSLIIFKVSKRKILLFILLVGGFSGIYIAKQYVQFNLLTTSSFAGYNLTHSVGISPSDYFFQDFVLGKETKQTLPDVLTRKTKITGGPNFNHLGYLKLNHLLSGQYQQYLTSVSVGTLLSEYWENAQIYFRPSSRYSENVIVDRLIWRAYYDMFFSAPVLPLIIIFIGLVELWRILKYKNFSSLGLLLPCLYIFAVCVFLEKGENMRLKYFLEPVFFVALVFYLSWLAQETRSWLTQKALIQNRPV